MWVCFTWADALWDYEALREALRMQRPLQAGIAQGIERQFSELGRWGFESFYRRHCANKGRTMGTKIKELPQASLSAKACDPVKGGCCSNHRRSDRIYEDQAWRFTLETGHYAFCDGSEADLEFHRQMGE